MPRIASKSSTLLNAPYDLRMVQNFVGGRRTDARHLL